MEPEQIILEIKSMIVTKMETLNDPAAIKILSECIDELRKMQKKLSEAKH